MSEFIIVLLLFIFFFFGTTHIFLKIKQLKTNKKHKNLKQGETKAAIGYLYIVGLCAAVAVILCAYKLLSYLRA